MTGSNDGWMMELRSAERSRLEAFIKDCTARGIHLELRRIHTINVADAPERYGLAYAQIEALETAFDAGYFDEPRRTSLEGLGERMGISRQAAEARLRRGIRNLIESTIYASAAGTADHEHGSGS